MILSPPYSFLVTAGGTREPLDRVRSIANAATGRLGSLIAASLASRAETGRVFFIAPAASALPASPKARIVRAETVADAEKAVRAVLGAGRIAGIVHSMAVSDYTVAAVTTPALAARGEALPRGGKISSDEPELLVRLSRAPKIIALLRPLAPDAVIIGFKLLPDAPRAELIAAAGRLIRSARCDFVFANTLPPAESAEHRGILAGADGSCADYEGKEAIAEGIVRALYQTLAGRGAPGGRAA